MPASRTDLDSRGAGGLSRRRFLADAGVTALAFSIVKPELVRGSQANSKIDLGLIGCGGRGTWIADLFKKHGGYNVVALADYFPDRVEAAGDKLGVPASSRFTGLSAYRRLLEQKLDAVAIESPPFFHPIQAADAVAAAKHVYLAKPAAVDVSGCLTIEQSAKKASASQRCFLIDFQTRATAPFIEAMRRVHSGALGSFVFGEATYHAEDPFLEKVDAVKSGTPEGVLRGWGLSREYSGDIITEQNIHTLDVMNWIMAKPPISASGTGGRKFRKVGTCWDTFSVTYKYADDVGIAFTSRQFDGFGTRPEGIRNRMFGTEGVLETEYGGQVLVRGKDFYNGGKTEDIYERGAVANIASFHDAIAKGDFSNPTVPESVRSNLVTILGRTAAYEGRVITWDELMKSEPRLTPDLKGLKD
jgi:predicted dehydrogenase